MLPLQVSLLIILEAGVGWGEQRRKSRVVKLACWNLFSLSQSRKIKKGEKRLSNLNLLSVQSASLGPAPSSCWVPLPASLELTATVQTKKATSMLGPFRLLFGSHLSWQLKIISGNVFYIFYLKHWHIIPFHFNWFTIVCGDGVWLLFGYFSFPFCFFLKIYNHNSYYYYL